MGTWRRGGCVKRILGYTVRLRAQERRLGRCPQHHFTLHLHRVAYRQNHKKEKPFEGFSNGLPETVLYRRCVGRDQPPCWIFDSRHCWVCFSTSCRHQLTYRVCHFQSSLYEAQPDVTLEELSKNVRDLHFLPAVAHSIVLSAETMDADTTREQIAHLGCVPFAFELNI